eukprot:COSAG01_NODE_3186_length_6441_cov_145.702460_6_plen_92_part_00
MCHSGPGLTADELGRIHPPLSALLGGDDMDREEAEPELPAPQAKLAGSAARAAVGDALLRCVLATRCSVCRAAGRLHRRRKVERGVSDVTW